MKPAPRTLTMPLGVGASFSGRGSELTLLRDALTTSRKGALQLVVLQGESGIGKSALVAQTLLAARQSDPRAIVLMGRCYEKDPLAYAAFESMMDGLTDALRRMPSDECDSLVPPKARLLGRLFPVLGAVDAIANGDVTGVPADPVAQRAAAYDAFAALLGNLGRERTVLIAIDDLQWADPESFRLLWSLAERHRELGLCLICTVRPREELSDEAAAQIGRLELLAITQKFQLGRLKPADARELASALLGREATPQVIDAVVDEAGGHPMFLAELSRFASLHSPSSGGRLTLESALATRTSVLDPRVRRLLEACAVAARPWPLDVFATALGASAAQIDLWAIELEDAHLIRRRGGRELVSFHDKTRRVVLDMMSKHSRRALHLAMALGLAASEASDFAEIARHYDFAGEARQAAEAFTRACAQSLAALAFSTAEEQARRALELGATAGLDPGWMSELHVLLGHALARSGRSADAAREYLLAVEHCAQPLKVRLRLWAAQHLLQSAQVDEGMHAAKALLADVGIALPTSDIRTVGRLAWDRLCIAFGRLELNPKPEVSESVAVQLEALDGLAYPVTWVDAIVGAGLNARHLRASLRSGNAGHAAKALAQEATFSALRRPHDTRVVSDLLRRSAQLGGSLEDPTVEVFCRFMSASAAIFRQDLASAARELEDAESTCLERCPNEWWLLTNIRANLLASWFWTGEHAFLLRQGAAWFNEARARGDQFGLTALTVIGCAYVFDLVDDQPDRAVSSIESAMAPWPRHEASLAHVGELVSGAQVRMYQGGELALEWIDAALVRLRRSPVVQAAAVSEMIASQRLLALLHACARTDERSRPRLLSRLRTCIRKAAASRSAVARYAPLQGRAELAVLEGDLSNAAALVQSAIDAWSTNGLIHAHALGYLLGLLQGGEEGLATRLIAVEYFSSRGWKQPLRAITMLAPSVAYLEARSA